MRDIRVGVAFDVLNVVSGTASGVFGSDLGASLLTGLHHARALTSAPTMRELTIWREPEPGSALAERAVRTRLTCVRQANSPMRPPGRGATPMKSPAPPLREQGSSLP